MWKDSAVGASLLTAPVVLLVLGPVVDFTQWSEYGFWILALWVMMMSMVAIGVFACSFTVLALICLLTGRSKVTHSSDPWADS